MTDATAVLNTIAIDAADDGIAELPPMRPRQRRRSIQAEHAQAVTEAKHAEAESVADNPVALVGGAAPPTTDEDPVVVAGREAWKRRKTDASWADWKLIGEALLVGRRAAMLAAGTNEPSGKRYINQFHFWLQKRGFGDLDKADRSKLLALMENLSAVEAWRAGLSEADRLRQNHPSAIWRAWKCPNRGGRFRRERDEGKTAPDGVVAALTEHVNAEHVEEFDEEQDELAWQRGLYWRAHKAAGEAALSLWALPEPPDERTISEVRRAYETLGKTLRYVESLPNTTAEDRAEARRSYAAAQAAQAKKRSEREQAGEAQP
jgi:hypothetical protein